MELHIRNEISMEGEQGAIVQQRHLLGKSGKMANKDNRGPLTYYPNEEEERHKPWRQNGHHRFKGKSARSFEN